MCCHFIVSPAGNRLKDTGASSTNEARGSSRRARAERSGATGRCGEGRRWREGGEEGEEQRRELKCAGRVTEEAAFWSGGLYSHWKGVRGGLISGAVAAGKEQDP